MFEKLGIAQEVAAKAKFAMGGPNSRVSVLVSSGEAEIGIQQVSELVEPGGRGDRHAAGRVAAHDALCGGVTTSAKQPDPARALIRHLATPAAIALYKAKGLQ